MKHLATKLSCAGAVGSLCAALTPLLPTQLGAHRLDLNNLGSMPAARVRTHQGGTGYVFAGHWIGTPTWKSPRKSLLGFMSQQVAVGSTQLDMRALPIIAPIGTRAYPLATEYISPFSSTLYHPGGSLPVSVHRLARPLRIAAGTNYYYLPAEHHLLVLPQPATDFMANGWSGSPVLRESPAGPQLQSILLAQATSPDAVGTALIGISVIDQQIQDSISGVIEKSPWGLRYLNSLVLGGERAVAAFLVAVLVTLKALTRRHRLRPEALLERP